MSSYKKYVMMGVSIVLIPLGKMVLKKIMSKITEKSEYDFAEEANGEFAPTYRPSERSAWHAGKQG